MCNVEQDLQDDKETMRCHHAVKAISDPGSGPRRARVLVLVVFNTTPGNFFNRLAERVEACSLPANLNQAF